MAHEWWMIDEWVMNEWWTSSRLNLSSIPRSLAPALHLWCTSAAGNPPAPCSSPEESFPAPPPSGGLEEWSNKSETRTEQDGDKEWKLRIGEKKAGGWGGGDKDTGVNSKCVIGNGERGRRNKRRTERKKNGESNLPEEGRLQPHRLRWSDGAFQTRL